jgi:hypothetical protein
MVMTYLLYAQILFLCGLSFQAQAAEPNAQTWMDEIQAVARTGSPLEVVYRMVVVTGWAKKFQPTLADLDFKEFNAEGMLKLADEKEVKWGYAMNTWPVQPKSPSWSVVQRFLGVAAISRSELVLFTPKSSSESWRLFHHNDQRPDLDVKVPGSPDRSVPGIKLWLNKSLGYSAVVLAATGEYVLVGRVTEDFKGNALQALAVKESHLSVRVKDNASKGLGILSYVSGKGPVAIFRTIFLEKGLTTVPVGTKLILENSP